MYKKYTYIYIYVYMNVIRSASLRPVSFFRVQSRLLWELRLSSVSWACRCQAWTRAWSLVVMTITAVVISLPWFFRSIVIMATNTVVFTIVITMIF